MTSTQQKTEQRPWDKSLTCSGHLGLANSQTIFALIKYPVSFLFYHQNVLGVSGKGCKWKEGVAEENTGCDNLHLHTVDTFSNLSRGCYAFKPQCCLSSLRQDRKTGKLREKVRSSTLQSLVEDSNWVTSELSSIPVWAATWIWESPYGHVLEREKEGRKRQKESGG